VVFNQLMLEKTRNAWIKSLCGLGFRVLALTTISSALTGCAHEPIFSRPIGDRSVQVIPAGHVVITQDNITPWIAHATSVDGYCSYYGANIANVDGNFYTINDVSNLFFKGTPVQIDGHNEPLVNGKRQSIEMSGFLNAINTHIHETCELAPFVGNNPPPL
jgi:hypothetical protein